MTDHTHNPDLDESMISDRPAERGASLVEYALLLSLIAVVCIAAVTALGESTTVPYSAISSGIAN